MENAEGVIVQPGQFWTKSDPVDSVPSTCSRRCVFNPRLVVNSCDATSDSKMTENGRSKILSEDSSPGDRPDPPILFISSRIVPCPRIDGTLVIRSIDLNVVGVDISSAPPLGIVAMSNAPSSQPRATAGSTYSCSKLKLDSLFLRWFSLGESQQIVRLGRDCP